jgi:hypothetical protein
MLFPAEGTLAGKEVKKALEFYGIDGQKPNPPGA